MKLHFNARLLACALALACTAHMPQAGAYVLELQAPSTASFSSDPLANGDFKDWFNFKVADPKGALVSAIGNSLAFANGASTVLTSFNLFDGDHATQLAWGSLLSVPVGPVNVHNGLLAPAIIQANHTYSLEIAGTVSGATANSLGAYGVSLEVAAVPEPEEWAMLLVGSGLVGFQVRRKQKGMGWTI
jgi:hypothetical protein